MESRICPSCRNEIDANIPYCNYCGAAQMPSPHSEVYPPEPTPQQWPRQQEQPIYAPQSSAYTLPTVYAEEGGGMGWIVFMRVILWIIFAASIIIPSIAGIIAMDYDVLLGLGWILGGVFGGFIIVAGGMISLNNASNQRKTTNNTAKILQLLQNQNRK